jgi:diaminohydroxyphosphoribosylaminopyrimidine deaminase/5-amino-6-(5-phosphoribosylamino)uracil reductase
MKMQSTKLSKIKQNDKIFMGKTLSLALKGLGRVSPNPLVGAVLVKNNRILATGYHKYFGAAHAEVDALKKIKFKAEGATLYCNLEPCCHQGKTPPCVDQVIKSGIKRVVIAQKDPNPKVNGRSIKMLRKKGIEVVVGVLQKEARTLNRFFNTFQEKKRPYVILKLAMTKDGLIAPLHKDKKKPVWISGESSRQIVHYWRAITDAILIGKNTAFEDEPRMNVRLKNNLLQNLFFKSFWTQKSIPASLDSFNKIKNKKPVRVIVSSKFELPEAVAINNSGPLLLAGLKKNLKLNNRSEIESIGFKEYKNGVCLKDVLKSLHHRGITSLYVEGGLMIAKSFIERNLIDELHVYSSSNKLGQAGINISNSSELKKAFSRFPIAINIGNDLLKIKS